MVEQERVQQRLEAIDKLLSDSDIEELYASDRANLNQIKSLADSTIPPDVDELASAFFSECDIEINDVDPVIPPVVRLLLSVAKVKGWRLKKNILETKVETWIIRAPSLSLQISLGTHTIYHSSCHECGRTFDEKRFFCPDCSAQIVDESHYTA